MRRGGRAEKRGCPASGSTGSSTSAFAGTSRPGSTATAEAPSPNTPSSYSSMPRPEVGRIAIGGDDLGHRGAIEDRAPAALVLEPDLIEHQPFAQIEAVAELPVAPADRRCARPRSCARIAAARLARRGRRRGPRTLRSKMSCGTALRGAPGLVVEPDHLLGVEIDHGGEPVEERAELVDRVRVGAEERAHEAAPLPRQIRIMADRRILHGDRVRHLAAHRRGRARPAPP